jgi:hypothetical protein
VTEEKNSIVTIAEGFYLHVIKGINGHDGDPQLMTGAEDANSDFSSIGNEDLLKHGFSCYPPTQKTTGFTRG